MSDVTQILLQIESGDPKAAENLLPVVYDELRKLAAARMAAEQPGQTLQATALVHEAYLRLVDVDKALHWHSRAHFFSAAAEAMRRILVENARRKKAMRHGGGLIRNEEIDLADSVAASESDENLISLHDVLDKLATEDSLASELVKLRYFVGFTIPEAADALGISPRKANLVWAYARAWLRQELEG